MGRVGLVKMVRILFAFGITAITASTQTFTTLATFNLTNGADPYFTPVIQGTDGNFYGTTAFGGAHTGGTVFKVTPDGTLTTFYSFCALTKCLDGTYPYAGLVLASNGNFYGTTTQGGTNNYGTVFELTPAGKLTTLHSFCVEVNCSDGWYPITGLVQATNGNLYGTTQRGGGKGGGEGDGTIFEITPAGKLTTLHTFCSQTNCTDGIFPEANLVQAVNGNLYGTTNEGGANGYGTVFSITPAGKLTTLHSFAVTDGAYPVGAMVQAGTGNFYGTTSSGGANSGGACYTSGCGTVFEITPAGKLTTRYNFCDALNCADGQTPYSGLMQATDGELYGTTDGGGFWGQGTLFRITPEGARATLHNFCGQSPCPDGAAPYAVVLQATNGAFYGVASNGAEYSDGAVYSLAEGLAPFVATVPTSGKALAKVIILGNNLTGTTRVSFNGTTATFTVVSDTEITAAAPTGATTGTVEVTTPSGTLNSNVVFHVVP